MNKIFIFILIFYASTIQAQDKRAIDAYNQGVSLYNNKNFPGAIKSFSQAITLDSNFSKAYFNRAICQVKTNAYAQAIQDFTKSEQLDTSKNNDRNVFGRAQAKYFKGDMEGALSDYVLASEKNPMNADACYFAGGILFDKGKYQEAINQFNKAIRARNDFAEAYNDRGSCKRQIEDYNGAIADYNEAIRLQPQMVQAYNNLAGVLAITAKLQEALAVYDNAIKMAPSQSSVYVKRGKVKFEMDDLNGAMSDFNKALELNPNDRYALNNRGCLKNKQQDYFGALADFDKAIGIDPEYGYAFLNRGVVKENMRDLKGACKDWNMASQKGITLAGTFLDAECN